MTERPIALVAYEPLADAVWPWAALARALGRLGRRPLYVAEPRAPTAGELARVAAAAGRWAPPAEAPTADGVVPLRPLDLPARRVRALASWDRTSLETALARHGDAGWVVVFSSALGKPWPRPEGWRVCWFPIDEFAADDARFAEREAALLDHCDLLVSVSDAVVAPRRDRVPAAAVLPNGYEHERFDEPAPPDPEIAALPRPRVGYAGTISPSKVDTDLVARLARARPQITFVLVGPRRAAAAAAPLFDLANVHLFDARPPAGVPAVLAAFDAVLLPYRDTPMNRACSPLKAREALAAGVPVVSSPVEELRAHPGAAVVCDDDDRFLAALDDAAAGRLRIDADAARFFTEGTWAARAATFAALLDRTAGAP